MFHGQHTFVRGDGGYGVTGSVRLFDLVLVANRGNQHQFVTVYFASGERSESAHPVFSMYKFVFNESKDQASCLTKSPTGDTVWSVENCLYMENPLAFDGNYINWATSSPTVTWNTVILTLFMSENILVWNDGADCLFDPGTNTWRESPTCRRYGPGPGPGPEYAKNRGPVWVLLRDHSDVYEDSRVFPPSYQSQLKKF